MVLAHLSPLEGGVVLQRGVLRWDGLRWLRDRCAVWLFVLIVLSFLSASAWSQSHTPAAPEAEMTWQWEHNPFSGDPERVRAGRSLFRRTCILCHGNRGGRGPNLTQSKLAGQDFLRVVMRGRKGTQMPAWRGKLSEEQIWTIMAYLGH